MTYYPLDSIVCFVLCVLCLYGTFASYFIALIWCFSDHFHFMLVHGVQQKPAKGWSFQTETATNKLSRQPTVQQNSNTQQLLVVEALITHMEYW